MKRVKLNTYSTECYETNEIGESIEEKVARITETNEPISDGVQMIYTPRKDGVLKQYNIRTDKWDVAQEAMNRVAAAKKGTIQKKLKGTDVQKEDSEKQPEQQPEQQPKEQTE